MAAGVRYAPRGVTIYPNQGGTTKATLFVPVWQRRQVAEAFFYVHLAPTGRDVSFVCFAFQSLPGGSHQVAFNGTAIFGQ